MKNQSRQSRDIMREVRRRRAAIWKSFIVVSPEFKGGKEVQKQKIAILQNMEMK